MRRFNFAVVGLVALVAVSGLAGCKSKPAPTQTVTPSASVKPGAPLFAGLSDHHHAVTTSSPLAQKYFDQGLRLCYAFNHDEAVRSFTEATRIDPDCAMAYWGVAYAHGMNINKPMAESEVPLAWDALQKAIAAAPKVSQPEQDYIAALSHRYTEHPVKERHDLDVAYADAMRDLMKKYPNDLDAATMYAEAVMDTTPWDYYNPDGTPKPAMADAIATIESVLQRDPNHIGAIHFYIHAVEASNTPQRAEPYADKLGALAPSAGHLVHMPGHIYLRVGRYADAADVNVKAVAADKSYVEQCNVQGYYPALYYSHNAHFLWYVAMMTGQSKLAMQAADETANITQKHACGYAFLEAQNACPVLTMVRFGKWDKVLATPQPPPAQVFTTQMWHYARGIALARTKDAANAQQQYDTLYSFAQSDAGKALDMPGFPGTAILAVADAELSAEIAGAKGDTEAYIKGLEQAVALQDKLPYMEPPFWFFPVRESLGAVLLDAGRPAAAEAVYRADLKLNPKNGWSLYGLAKSLHAQNKDAEAAAIDRDFKQSWQYADVPLTASRF